jgi:hypothetical protein
MFGWEIRFTWTRVGVITYLSIMVILFDRTQTWWLICCVF